MSILARLRLLPAACSSAHRAITTSTPARDLREFLDQDSADLTTYGRAWKAYELRSKSWEDLHKLWYVCIKEKNMLGTALLWAGDKPGSRNQNQQAYTTRLKEVKLTMNRIKQVLGERIEHDEQDAVRKAELKRILNAK